MPEPSREERYKAQTTEQFAALGRFVQEFEQAVFELRRVPIFLFGGFNTEQQRRAQVMVGHEAITAMAPMDIVSRLIGEIMKTEDAGGTELDAHTAEAREIKELMMRLTVCFFPERRRVLKNFTRDGDRWLPHPPA